MQIKSLLFPILLGATAVCAGNIGLKEIVSVMADVASASIRVNSTVNRLSGSLWDLQLVDFAIGNTKLVEKIKIATKITQRANNLTDAEAMSMTRPASQLVDIVDSTVDSLIRAKPKLKSALVTSLIPLVLRDQKRVSTALNNAIVDVTPEKEKETARQFGEWISQAFDKGLAAFS